jgi:signal transduction histidine kinase
MDHLIQDVLSFSRLSRQEIVLERVDADALLHDMMGTYPNLHSDIVTIFIRAKVPCVMGNAALLTQCFANLLENAVKFTAAGEKPRIEVWGEENEGRVRLFFQDNGIGIAGHNLGKIFDIFHRIGRDREGTGIGLAIVRKAVERMDGKVGVSSEVGKGSLFWLDLKSADSV